MMRKKKGKNKTNNDKNRPKAFLCPQRQKLQKPFPLIQPLEKVHTSAAQDGNKQNNKQKEEIETSNVLKAELYKT